jgi:hypothetical protein
MKIFKHLFFVLSLLAAVCRAQAQGVIYIYDQQSSTNESFSNSGGNMWIQDATRLGQSFTPSLSTVGFIRLSLGDRSLDDNLGVNLYLTLRQGSINGSILATSDVVFLTDGYRGYTNFIFSVPVAVTPGATYVFELLVQSGGNWVTDVGGYYNYPNGTAITLGLPSAVQDFWFREGITIPAAAPPLGISTYSNRPALFFPTLTGTNHVLQMSTNLTGSNWVTVSNGIPISGLIITNPPTNAFFRLY